MFWMESKDRAELERLRDFRSRVDFTLRGATTDDAGDDELIDAIGQLRNSRDEMSTDVAMMQEHIDSVVQLANAAASARDVTSEIRSLGAAKLFLQRLVSVNLTMKSWPDPCVNTPSSDDVTVGDWVRVLPHTAEYPLGRDGNAYDCEGKVGFVTDVGETEVSVHLTGNGNPTEYDRCQLEKLSREDQIEQHRRCRQLEGAISVALGIKLEDLTPSRIRNCITNRDVEKIQADNFELRVAAVMNLKGHSRDTIARAVADMAAAVRCSVGPECDSGASTGSETTSGSGGVVHGTGTAKSPADVFYDDLRVTLKSCSSPKVIPNPLPVLVDGDLKLQRKIAAMWGYIGYLEGVADTVLVGMSSDDAKEFYQRAMERAEWYRDRIEEFT